MVEYELNNLVKILNNDVKKSELSLLRTSGFIVFRTVEDEKFVYEDYLLEDESHCITHVLKFNDNEEIISQHWEVTY